MEGFKNQNAKNIWGGGTSPPSLWIRLVQIYN